MSQKDWTIRGAMDPLGDKEITVCVQNTQHPDLPAPLGVYLYGKLAGEILAYPFRPELVKAGIGNGHHGFVFALPAGTHQSVDLLEVWAPHETIIVYSRAAGRTSA